MRKGKRVNSCSFFSNSHFSRISYRQLIRVQSFRKKLFDLYYAIFTFSTDLLQKIRLKDRIVCTVLSRIDLGSERAKSWRSLAIITLYLICSRIFEIQIC